MFLMQYETSHTVFQPKLILQTAKVRQKALSHVWPGTEELTAFSLEQLHQQHQRIKCIALVISVLWAGCGYVGLPMTFKITPAQPRLL
jgi:hypothetical protein